MQENIIWREIPGFEGYYEVSSKGGKVRGIERIVSSCYGSTQTRKPKERSVKSKYCGRLKVNLSKEGKCYYFTVYQLVARAFPEICGEWFDGCEVHHKDLNPINNDADNLAVLTKKQHDAIHKASTETRKKRVEAGKKNGKPIVQKKNGVPVFVWRNAVEAAEIGGFCYRSIQHCLYGEYSNHKGYTFEYL